MCEDYNLCIVKPNKSAFSETFITEHINRLKGNKKVLYGGSFPVYDDQGKYLINSIPGMISYLIQKRIFKKQRIAVRTNALKKYLIDKKIDVVFAEYGTVGAMITEACWLANVPLVVHFHGADAHHHKTVGTYGALYQKMFAYASAIIAVSGDMVEVLKALGAPAEKIHQSSCGVDTQMFPVLGVINTPRQFLFAGRFVEKKSPLSVVKAFAIVVKQFPDAKLSMAGTGPLFDETQRLINELHLEAQITLTGVLKPDVLKEYMTKTRCFVQHSVTAANGDKEGTPVTILEAGSSGLAIVSTFHAGIKEAVIHNETGYLVPEHDIEGMAKYMAMFAADVKLAAEMGRKEAVHIRQHYDMKSRIALLDGLIYKAYQQKHAANAIAKTY